MTNKNSSIAKNTNEKEFLNKVEVIKCFREPLCDSNDNFTLVTGTNNELKRNFIENMLVNSSSEKLTLFVDTRGLMNNNSINLISSHPLVVGEVKNHSIYEDGIPVNLFSVAYNKSNDEKAVDLFDVCSSVYQSPDSVHMDLLEAMLSIYVDEEEELTDCSVAKAARSDKMNIFEILMPAEAHTVNDYFLHELHCSIDSDLDDCKVLFDSWGNIINPKLSLYYTFFNSGSRDSAIPLANMYLASLRNYRKRNHETPIDLYINDISDLNFSCTGSIRKIINEAERLNINVIGISADYYMPSTPEGEVMSSARKQYFLFPTRSSKEHVNTALQIRSGEEWPFKDMMYGTAIVKEINLDKLTGENIATVYRGKIKDYFMINEYIKYHNQLIYQQF